MLSSRNGRQSGTARSTEAMTADTNVLLTIPQISVRPTTYQNSKRFVIAFISLLACVLGIWSAGQAGFSHLLYEQAVKRTRPDFMNAAVRLSPSDPQAHYARASMLSQRGQLADATSEFETAVALRPSDYVLWLDLGTAREQIGDQEGALAAFREAARLAPYYARPRWVEGQLLLRAGHRDEAFDSFRRAVTSRPTLLSEVIDLAWKAYGGDVPAVQRAIDPQNSHERLTLARFMAKQGRMDEAMQLFRLVGDITDSARLAFLNELLDDKRFKEAYEIWSISHKQTDSASNTGLSAITDGNFESRISPDEPGFGWQLPPRAPAISISLDSYTPRAGDNSLLLRFGGDAQASTPLIKQLVLVSPLTHYRLSFASRTEKLVTGGPPLVFVTDASSNDGSALAQSLPLPIGTVGWRDYTVDFTTSDTTSAISIGVKRQNCSSDPCPIFGSIWFDAFSLHKL